jgi:hypothetical protein
MKVALKTLTSIDAVNVYLLKNEFRSLADVRHPNLVRLYELSVDDDALFLTMELVDGVRFDEWVRPYGLEDGERQARLDSRKLDEARLRMSLPQLFDAVAAIHAAGKLHRDLKPSNVLVTREGRVVVLDFGLAVDPEPGGVGQTLQDDAVSGTPAYMAPEQAAGAPACAAGDFYACGVMLFEALSGQLPFSGSPYSILVEKQLRAAPQLSKTDASPDLAALCDSLLARCPDTRPDVATIRAALGPSPDPHSVAPPLRLKRNNLLGRADEFDELKAAFEDTCSGRAVAMFVSGESGAGKSALCDAFLDELRERQNVVVIRGRCHEREHVPFKGIDSLVDDLSRYLRRLPDSDAAGLMPREIYALERIFPVLGRIDAVAQAPHRSIIDLQELRQRAFSAFCELAARIRDRSPLLFYIDDAQWLDGDATTFLGSFFSYQESVPAMLLLSHRSEAASANPQLNRLSQLLPLRGRWERREIRLGPLPHEAARELATRLLGTELAARADEVASEANGSPFFVRALSRYTLCSERHERPTLQEAVLAQIDALQPGPRKLLEILAVASRPVPVGVALDAAAAAHNDVDKLRDESLIRVGESGREISIECYHHKISESLVQALSEERLKQLHGRLLTVLELSGIADPQHLALHACGEGSLFAAARYFAMAAERASELLAFDQAALLYSRALEYRAYVESERRDLHTKRGEALVNAGRGAEAAHEYIEAARGAEHDHGIDLTRRAAEQLLVSGHIDEGKKHLTRVLRTIGIRLPASSYGTRIWLSYERARLSLRGLAFHEREDALPAARQRELDILFSAVRGLLIIDMLSGAALCARYVRLALDSGVAARAAWAFATEAWFATAISAGTTGTRIIFDELLTQAETLSSASNDPATIGWTCFARGAMAFALGDQRSCKTLCDSAIVLFRERCTGVAFDLATARHFSLASASDLGEFMPATEVAALIDDGWRRNDLYAALSYTGYGVIGRLIQGDEEGIQRHVDEARSRWRRPSQYSWPDWFLLFAETWLDVFLGKPAQSLARIESELPALERAGILRSPASTDVLFCRGASALAASRTNKRDASRLCALAARSARELQGSGRALSIAYGQMLAGWLALEENRSSQAIAHLRQALSRFKAAGVLIYAVVVSSQLSDLIGGVEGASLKAQAEAEARSMGAPNLSAMTRLLTFGLSAD